MPKIKMMPTRTSAIRRYLSRVESLMTNYHYFKVIYFRLASRECGAKHCKLASPRSLGAKPINEPTASNRCPERCGERGHWLHRGVRHHFGFTLFSNWALTALIEPSAR